MALIDRYEPICTIAILVRCGIPEATGDFIMYYIPKWWIGWAIRGVNLVLLAVLGTSAFLSEYVAKHPNSVPGLIQVNAVLSGGLVKPVLAGMVLFTQRLLKSTSDADARKVIKKLLNIEQSRLLRDNNLTDASTLTVTLFTRSRFPIRSLLTWQRPIWNWSGWFRPIERSGEFRLKSIPWFPANERGCEGEGLCGIIFRRTDVVQVQDLPDLDSSVVGTDREESIKRYSNETSVTQKWLSERLANGRPTARSFCGVVVEANGKRWGVLLIDCRNSRLIVTDNEIEFMAGMLSTVLAH